MKKQLALFLFVLMCVSFVPNTAFADEVTITYVVDGEKSYGIYPKGTTVPREAVPWPSEEERCFLGWYQDDEEITLSDISLEEDMTVTAVYEEEHLPFEETLKREPTCSSPGLKVEFCRRCRFAREIPTETIPHLLQFVEENPSDCIHFGTAAHFVCQNCGACFWSEDSEEELSDEDLRLKEYGSHRMEPVEEVPSTCRVYGSQAHFVCTICEKHFLTMESELPASDEELRLETLGPHILSAEPVPGTPSDCMHYGTRACYLCTVCGARFLTKEDSDPATDEQLRLTELGKHRLRQIEEVPPDCSHDGIRAHYVCDVCGEAFLDSEGLEPATAESLRIMEPGMHKLKLVARQEAGCLTEGVDAYYICSACQGMFADAAGTRSIETPAVLSALGHSLEEVEGESSTCLTPGHVRYYRCSRCGALFLDREGETPVTEAQIVIPTAPHHLVYMEGVAASCTTPGSMPCYVCSDCGRMFSDEGGTETSPEAVALSPLGHDCLTVEAVPAASCLVSGHTRYYECRSCGKLFDADWNEISSLDSIEIRGGHSVAFIPEVSAGCDEDGSIAYYQCSVCKRMFSDKEGTQEIFSTVLPAHHTLTHVKEKTPTCVGEGVREHYVCSNCGLLFLDASGKDEVSENALRLPAYGHDFHNGVCSHCGMAEERFQAQIIRGNDGTAYYGSSYTFILNTDYETVRDNLTVWINDWQLSAAGYTLASGSTVVTLTQDCIRSLAEGTYNISFVTVQGTASGVFRVKASSPKTGDMSCSRLWAATAALAVAAEIITVYRLKRKRKRI